MSATLIDGTSIAAEVRGEVGEVVAEMRSKHGIAPGLAVVLIGDDPASTVYVRMKERAAIEAGMVSETINLPADTPQEEALAAVQRLNEDARYHGILVQLPLPDHIDEDTVIQSINPDKDVDGLHPFNMGLLMAGKPRFIPATPAGIQQMLMRTGNDPSGKHVVVCGRSNIVGKPIMNLLMQRQDGANATVSVCHTRTRDLAAMTRQADILIAAVGSPRMITADMVSEGVVVIDVGVNRVDAPERRRGYRLVGDVDFDAVAEKAAAITPVPGGVGPMTIAMLLQNTMNAARWSIHPDLR
ncbi:MAG: bifunctional methylenetetrahydrofolate dehydrogenase/methenyltetrahydrofolate cyclohydrolase FolD [Chloroflexota bacterium]|nr:bifunctional methylenetetrahydrofolate dehydrogenase/methenyltetrahydrofolate cyclohydrolase FolD [Chloroflexota bacterium]